MRERRSAIEARIEGVRTAECLEVLQLRIGFRQSSKCLNEGHHHPPIHAEFFPSPTDLELSAA